MLHTVEDPDTLEKVEQGEEKALCDLDNMCVIVCVYVYTQAHTHTKTHVFVHIQTPHSHYSHTNRHRLYVQL